jgi:hypothetical protein
MSKNRRYYRNQEQKDYRLKSKRGSCIGNAEAVCFCYAVIFSLSVLRVDSTALVVSFVRRQNNASYRTICLQTHARAATI